jgi:hypothetical protein
MSKQQDMGYGDDVQEAEPIAAEQVPPRDTPQDAAHKEEQRVARRNEPIALGKGGILVPRDNVEDARIASMMLDTGALPKCFVSVPQVVLAVQMLRGLGISPALGIRQVMIVPKTQVLSIWGELPKAACQSDIVEFKEFRFDKDYTPISFGNKNLDAELFGAYCLVRRRDVADPVESTFLFKEAIAAGLTGNKETPWVKYPNRMLQMRARSKALKDLFPDRLSGVSIAEYDFNMLDGRGTPTYGENSIAAANLADEINALPEVGNGGE